MRRLRRRTQMIFQDPYASLNPRWTVGSIVGEPLRVHQLRPAGSARTERVKELLAMVRHLRDRVAVMYLGIMVELAARDTGWPVTKWSRRHSPPPETYIS